MDQGSPYVQGTPRTPRLPVGQENRPPAAYQNGSAGLDSSAYANGGTGRWSQQPMQMQDPSRTPNSYYSPQVCDLPLNFF